jgi:diacylglycerol kinase
MYIAITVVAKHNVPTVIEGTRIGNREQLIVCIERNREANMGQDANNPANHRREARSRPKRWLLPKRISFRHALRGVYVYFREQTHARFHFAAALCVLAVAFWLQIDSPHFAMLLLAIGLVWVAEGLNTAMEYLADAAVPQTDPLIRNAKDVAAGSVLLAAIIASLVGLCVLGPPFLNWFSSASR